MAWGFLVCFLHQGNGNDQESTSCGERIGRAAASNRIQGTGHECSGGSVFWASVVDHRGAKNDKNAVRIRYVIAFPVDYGQAVS